MRLLDLFCGAGGAAVGYYRAGFTDITGVDIKQQKNYPFEFIQSDALEYLENCDLMQFDLIHASPPCQAYTSLRALHPEKEYPELIEPIRTKIEKHCYVIENVVGAPLENPLMLCGTMFGLRVFRHRLFECNPVLWWPPAACCHDGKSQAALNSYQTLDNLDFITVSGHNFRRVDGMKAMGIDWHMTGAEVAEAIPPAYTEWIGKQLSGML